MIKAEKKGTKWICDLNDAEVDVISKIDKTAISDSPELLLVIESWGQMKPEDVLKGAVSALTSNLASFEKAIK
jgi:hypothetical protein